MFLPNKISHMRIYVREQDNQEKKKNPNKYLLLVSQRQKIHRWKEERYSPFQIFQFWNFLNQQSFKNVGMSWACQLFSTKYKYLNKSYKLLATVNIISSISKEFFFFYSKSVEGHNTFDYTTLEVLLRTSKSV